MYTLITYCNHIVQHNETQFSGNLHLPKDKIINIRIDPELKKLARKQAAAEQRSLSNWITWLIQRELKKAGSKS